MIVATDTRLSPSDLTLFAGARALLTCSSAITGVDVVGVQWLVNGSPLEDLNLMNVLTDFSEINRVGSLVIDPITLEYNATTIQCIATFSSGNTSHSNTATLLVQGELYTMICLYQ